MHTLAICGTFISVTRTDAINYAQPAAKAAPSSCAQHEAKPSTQHEAKPSTQHKATSLQTDLSDHVVHSAGVGLT